MKSFTKLLGMGLTIFLVLIPLINLGSASISTQFNYAYEIGDVVVFRSNMNMIKHTMSYDEVANDGSYINISTTDPKIQYNYRLFENITKIDANHLNMTLSSYTNATATPVYTVMNVGNWTIEEANRTRELNNTDSQSLIADTFVIPTDVFFDTTGLAIANSINNSIVGILQLPSQTYDIASILDLEDLVFCNSSVNTIVPSSTVTRAHGIIGSTLTFAGNVTRNSQVFNASVVFTASVDTTLGLSHLLNHTTMTFTLNTTLSNSTVGTVYVGGTIVFVEFTLVYDSTGQGFLGFPPETTTDTDDGETTPFNMWYVYDGLMIVGGLTIILAFYYSSASYQAKCVEGQAFCRSKKNTKPEM